jgi:hypothetical protein
MTPKILMSLLAIFVLIKTYNLKTNFKKEVSLLLCFSILVTWFTSEILISIGIISCILASIWITIKGFTENNLSKIVKANFIILGLFSTIGLLFALMNWPFATYINIAMVIPIILYLYTSIKTKLKFNKNYLFLSILALDCVLRFLRIF